MDREGWNLDVRGSQLAHPRTLRVVSTHSLKPRRNEAQDAQRRPSCVGSERLPPTRLSPTCDGNVLYL